MMHQTISRKPSFSILTPAAASGAINSGFQSASDSSQCGSSSRHSRNINYEGIKYSVSLHPGNAKEDVEHNLTFGGAFKS